MCVNNLPLVAFDSVEAVIEFPNEHEHEHEFIQPQQQQYR